MRTAASARQPDRRANGERRHDASAPQPRVTVVKDGAAPASLHALYALCARYMPPEHLELVRDAYAVAAKAHAGVTRKSGEPYIEHPLAVARILCELAMDAPGIAAALLHDTVEDTDLSLDDIAIRFGPVIAMIVDGVTKFGAAGMDTTTPAGANGRTPAAASVAGTEAELQAKRERKARQQVETVQKLLLALVEDPRVVLLKLADRLHNMRTMASMSPAQRERISRETLDIYVPLAERIGLYAIKTELEDLAFFHLDPEASTRTAARLAAEVETRLAWAERMCATLRDELAASGISAAVNWRAKRVYRAHREAQQSGVDIAQLHDIIAFRVLVNATEDCYRTLGIIHRLWQPHGERIRDYIATPKTNGYQSLHTAVFALDGRLAQMHIRTHTMHRATQHGVAVQWLERAAAGLRDDAMAEPWVEKRPAWIKQVSQWHTELKLSADEFVRTIRGELLDEQIFVFTPKGQVHEFPAGSTVLDFAYKIHSEVGDRAVGAVVQTTARDGMLDVCTVPVSHVLQTGDIVRVLTERKSSPKTEWLAIAETRYARERINRSLKQREHQHPETPRRDGEEPTAEVEPDSAGTLLHPSGSPARIQLGRCCYPCPGDEIVGLADRGRALTVHRQCCATLARTAARRRARSAAYATPVRLYWESLGNIAYCLRLAIYGQDHQGLMYEVSACVAQLGLSVASSAASANQDRYKAAITLTLVMSPATRKEVVMRRLRAVAGVTQVERDSRKGCIENDE